MVVVNVYVVDTIKSIYVIESSKKIRGCFRLTDVICGTFYVANERDRIYRFDILPVF